MATDNPFDRMPESEKLRIVDKALSDPQCSIQQKAVPFLTKAHKLDLFNQFVESGAIRYEGYTPPQQHAQSKENTLPSTFDEILERLPPAKARRLIELRRAYRTIDMMPGYVQVELRDIMASARNAPPPRRQY